MRTADSIISLNACMEETRKENISIGYVPTMGYLHEGHLALVKRAKRENEFVVVSIFVNPIQFGPQEDFNTYPRGVERDRDLLKKEGVDLLFTPSDDEMFDSHGTFVYVEEMSGKLCDPMRPDHFKGVATIVLKLFNVVQPGCAYFGKKDFQQYFMLKKMVRDLNVNVSVRGVETVREADGLALSSRNVYLDTYDRGRASFIPKSIEFARSMVVNGERNPCVIENNVREMLSENSMEVEYVEVRSSESLERETQVQKGSRIFVALRLGNTRLIDNRLLEDS